MTVLHYKGYTGEVEVDLDAGILFGRVQDLRDVITFQCETIAGVRQAFEDSIDDYLTWCAERGEDPDRPYSGKLPFRTTPAHHRSIAHAATIAGMSINAWMETVLVGATEDLLSARPRRSYPVTTEPAISPGLSRDAARRSMMDAGAEAEPCSDADG